MLIIPAIDLLGGKVVRLREGRREEATVYSDRPGEIARAFVGAGAGRLHVVDLDGAFAGGGDENRRAIDEILTCGAEIQLGGGLRTVAACEGAAAAGVRLVVLGSALIKEPRVVEEACRALPGRVVVAVDAKHGKVAISGWTEVTGVDAVDAARRAVEAGAASILYTDISRDGTGVGPNVEATARLQAALPVPVIASGGIGALAHLHALRAAGVQACVVGRALYEKKFTLAEALA